MPPKARQTVDKHFATLEDPRHPNALQHPLLAILVISICATICGADGWTAIALWGESSEGWCGGYPFHPLTFSAQTRLCSATVVVM